MLADRIFERLGVVDIYISTYGLRYGTILANSIKDEYAWKHIEYKTIDYSEGDIIFKAGDIINKLYIIKSGEVTCIAINNDRLVPVYNVIDSAGVIGEDEFFFNKRKSNYFAIAMSDVKVMEIPKADIMKFVNSSSDWIHILFNISEKVAHTDVITEHRIIDEKFNGGKLLTAKEEVLIKKSLGKKII